MKCLFGIDFCIDEGERACWERWTKGAPLPDVYELDLECAPAKGDYFSFEFTFGKQIIQLYGTIKSRLLCDDRKNVNSRWKDVYYWYKLKDVEVGLLDRVNKEN